MAITVYRIAKMVGRDPSLLYRIKKGKQICSPKLAKELDALGIPGWRFGDLRPDLVEMALRAVNHD